MKKIFYLDHCGTTPLYPEVKRKLIEICESDLFGNPSASHHTMGSKASFEVETARDSIAREFGITSSEVIFCASATEANNLAIQGFMRKHDGKKCRIFYNPTEHKAVTLPCENEASHLTEVKKIPLDSKGNLDLSWLEMSFMENSHLPILVCIMGVNNELPLRFPIEAIEKICKKANAFFHCDATQWVVREKIDLGQREISSLSFSGHKIYGPKGIGALILPKKQKMRIKPIFFGGEQEQGLRPGTLNVPGILGLSEALRVTAEKRISLQKHLAQCDEIFTQTLEKGCSKLFRKTISQSTASGIVNFYFENINAMTLMTDLPFICLNRGASCTGSGGEKFSHVPAAIGLPLEISANVLRASFGWGCTVQDVRESAEILVQYVLRSRP